MDLLVNFGWLVLGLVLLYYGAEWLVRGSSTLAISCGLSPLVVGLTVVAFGTSAPELVVSVKANLDGSGGMALGNVVGSNICNIALVLGVGAIISPISVVRQVVRQEMPILLTVTLLVLGFLYDGVVARWEGVVLTVTVVGYTIFSILQARRESKSEQHDGGDVPEEVIAAAREGGAKQVAFSSGLVVAGVVLLVVGADRMVFGGRAIADRFGVPEEVIALTLFAFGTSLPELATSVVASLKKQGDIVVGNVVGSCIFNLLAVTGITAMVAPIGRGTLTMVDLGLMLALTAIVWPMMRTGMSVRRLEGGVLLAVYLGYFAWLALA